MMLLCVFFVLMLSISKVETVLFEQARTGITGDSKGTLVELAQNLEKIVTGSPGIPGVKIRVAKDGVRLDLDNRALFATGSAVLKDGALEPLAPLFREILATKYRLDVEGHTDDLALYQVVDGELETNWSLSGRRASVVLQALLDSGFPTERLRIVGYAATKPLAKTLGLEGDQLRKARARNRRVTLLVR